MDFEKNIWGSQWGGYFETARYGFEIAESEQYPPIFNKKYTVNQHVITP